MCKIRINIVNFIINIFSSCYSQVLENKILYLVAVIFIILVPTYALYLIKKKSVKSESLQKRIFISIISIAAICLVCMPFIFQTVRSATSLIYNENIKKALQDSSLLVNAYNKENNEKIATDIMIIARTINDQMSNHIYDAAMIKNLIESYSALKGLSEIVIFIPSKNMIIAKNDLSFSLSFDYLPTRAIEEASTIHPVLIENMNLGKIRAVIELENFPYKTYLMIARHIDEKITEYFNNTKNALTSYEKLSYEVQKIQTGLLTIFAIVFLVVIVAIRILALRLTKQMIDPVENLTRIVSDENMKIEDFEKIRFHSNIREVDILSDAFYKKIKQIDDSNKIVDAHSNLIQEIFKQTSSGLLIINKSGKIIMQNQASIDLLSQNVYRAKDQFFEKIMISIDQILKSRNGDLRIEKNIDIFAENEEDGNKVIYQHFLAHIAKARVTATEMGEETFLIVFNNISEHIANQRNALWIDVAKRITHEIRNPLTPIMLSAERLEYKYSKCFERDNDKDDFIKYLDNIKKHTNTISNIIDEFVAFGRMPEPKFEQIDLVAVIQETINGSYFDKQIKYDFNIHSDCGNYDEHLCLGASASDVLAKIYINADEKQIMRALLNIFKNSYEALQSDIICDNNKLIKIDLYHKEQSNNIIIIIEDFGPGFPNSLIDKIAEPYVTTKSRGSGLGLSIVKKIIDDHGGRITFSNKSTESKGALVKIELL